MVLFFDDGESSGFTEQHNILARRQVYRFLQGFWNNAKESNEVFDQSIQTCGFSIASDAQFF